MYTANPINSASICAQAYARMTDAHSKHAQILIHQPRQRRRSDLRRSLQLIQLILTRCSLLFLVNTRVLGFVTGALLSFAAVNDAERASLHSLALRRTLRPASLPLPADDARDARLSTSPAPGAYTPASSKYPRAPASSARCANPRHAPPCASRSYAAACADSRPCSPSSPGARPIAASVASPAVKGTAVSHPAAKHPFSASC